ncbi:MAG: HEPN domain-containing protein [Chloroflexota bacterium]|nr:HEPN domain-containing protein [Chloroflexota bacterium]
MTVDVRRIARTQAWLVKAQRDLVTVEQILVHDHPMLDSVVYHCQQAGEKALKSFLFWHDTPFRKTHDLVALLLQCVALDTTLSFLEETANFLTPLGVEFRYPSDILEPPLDEAQEAFERAKVLLAEIVKRLPSDVAPAV